MRSTPRINPGECAHYSFTADDDALICERWHEGPEAIAALFGVKNSTISHRGIRKLGLPPLYALRGRGKPGPKPQRWIRQNLGRMMGARG
jgi:hypothetical protein